MRRQRRTFYPLAFLTAAIGITAAPAIAAATAEPVGDGVPSPEQAAPAEPAEPVADEPPAVPATDTPETPPTTSTPATEPDAPVEPAEPAATTPEPTTPAAGDETTVIEPAESPIDSTPATTAPSHAPEREADDELDADVSTAVPDDVVIRPIAFPVLGPVRYGNDWGACRDGCDRRHQGTDIIGVRMQPLLAAVDGTVTRIRYENTGTAGAVITVTGADGWYYNYFHVNNDTPGTDDGAAGPEWQVVPGLTVGSTVRAGQVVGYMGDSGNAESSVAHLHFEIRQPDRTPVNPYHSLSAAQRGETCAAGAGVTMTPANELSSAVVAIIPLDGGGSWLIDRDGRLFAEGSAAGPTCAVDAFAGQPTGPAEPASSPVVDVVAVVSEPAPAAPAAPAVPATWTVERGQSLWRIAQAAYGVSDVATTASLVNVVFDHNRDVVSEPSVIEIGTTLQLPSVV